MDRVDAGVPKRTRVLPIRSSTRSISDDHAGEVNNPGGTREAPGRVVIDPVQNPERDHPRSGLHEAMRERTSGSTRARTTPPIHDENQEPENR